MKIAISGKGGVGKTLFSAFLARAFENDGWAVIAVDADPDSNLAATLGFPGVDKIVPISHLKALIEERAGVKGGYFNLNPKVDDLPETYSVRHGGIRLMVMGEIKQGGSGCYCPENAMLNSLMRHLLLGLRDVVILDMSAGIEHLSRGTVRAVDRLIIVVEPGRASFETAQKVRRLATDLGIHQIVVVGNKVHNEAEKQFIASEIDDMTLLGFIPFDPDLIKLQMENVPVTASPVIEAAVLDVYRLLTTTVSNAGERRPNGIGS